MSWAWMTPQQTRPPQETQPQRSPDFEFTIYAGDYGFGLSGDTISSPGPELRVKQGSLVKLTLVNIGRAMHVLTVVGELKEDPYVLPIFEGAQAGSLSNPVPPGGSLTVYFIADKPGTYYYICNIPGHVRLGMWGLFVVEQ